MLCDVLQVIFALSLRKSECEGMAGRVRGGHLTALCTPLISGKWESQTLSGFWTSSTELSEESCGLE